VDLINIKQNLKPIGVGLRKINFFILFTLDKSGTMSGYKWKNLCNCVYEILISLNEDDYVSAITFSDGIEIIDPPSNNKFEWQYKDNNAWITYENSQLIEKMYQEY